MQRLDLTGLAYLSALGLALYVGYKVYTGGKVAAAAVGDALHNAVQAVGKPIEDLKTAVLDAIVPEPPAVRDINTPVLVPPPASQWTGTDLFPSGQFVGDLQDASGFYSSPYALHRDREGANNANVPNPPGSPTPQ